MIIIYNNLLSPLNFGIILGSTINYVIRLFFSRNLPIKFIICLEIDYIKFWVSMINLALNLGIAEEFSILIILEYAVGLMVILEYFRFNIKFTCISCQSKIRQIKKNVITILYYVFLF